MLANDMKKGTKVIQTNGWHATIMDNKKGIIRLAEVQGFVTEIGSIYIDDIDMVLTENGWENIEFSPAQKKQIDRKNSSMMTWSSDALGW